MDRDRELHEMADEGRALMSDYIKRENIAKYAGGLFRNETDEKPIGYLMSEYQINSIPSEDVAPVRHGRWIEYGENKDGTHNICCSVCDGFFKSKGHANSCYTRNKYRYCHNCGARMDAKE